MSDTLADLMRQAAEIDRQPAQPSPPAATTPADAPTVQRAPGAPETLVELEARLRADYEARLQAARMEAERPANEALLKSVLRRDYVPPPKPAATATPRTRRDGSMLTAYDLKLAAEMQREFPNIDFTGARIPPNYWR